VYTQTIKRQRSSIGRSLGFFLGSRGLGSLLVVLLVACAGSTVYGEQTRAQCEKCCQKADHDEYYLEQCKLKCFRSPDHCMDQSSKSTPAARTEAPPPPPRTSQAPPAAQPPQALRPPVQPGPPSQMGPSAEAGPPAGPPRAKEGEVVFRWPNPLNLTPGKEWEAAGQILGANGITPQHPGYPAALKAVEAVLLDFARRNPAGGQLPTDQLVKILIQLK
jgi:hypothetical protein